MRRQLSWAVIVSLLAMGVFLGATASAEAAFGIKDFGVTTTDPSGALDTQAGSHPDLSVAFAVNVEAGGEEAPEGELSALYVHLPPGLVGDPRAVPTCPRGQFAAGGACPPSSAVGIAFVSTTIEPKPAELAIYNLSPPLGSPAMLAGTIFTINSFQEAALRSESDFGIDISDASFPQAGIKTVNEVIWGRPYEASHDEVRGEVAINCRATEPHPCPTPFEYPEHPSGRPEHLPFLTLPTSCATSLRTTLELESLEEPGNIKSASVEALDGTAGPARLSGCGSLAFEPAIATEPSTTHADSPTGLNVAIHQPQNENPEGTASAALDTAKVTLPEGMTLNPSAANGLGSCSEAQVGRLSVPGIHFDKVPQSCPNAAKVGLAEVSTPLLDHKLHGAVYVATPFKNPFNSLLAIYLVVEDELSGTYTKLAGKVEPNPATGQLTATFSENPQLPLEDIDLSFFGGDRAALKTPLACGTYTTQTVLTPWSAPESPSATPSSSFAVSTSASGSGGCPSTEAAAPNSPSFEAGTTNPIAGSYSPFVLKLNRPDGSQHIASIQTTLPEGLLGRLAGTPYCPEGQITLAKSREAPEMGKVEQASPSCPSSSEVGTVTVGAGAGGTPFYANGHVYLAGPYKGAPLSLVIIVPAVAGPFDLGNVVSRVALNVGEYSAQINAVSDALPTIVQGIPLDIRSIALELDRSNFTLNPTSCEQKQITGTMTSQAGQAAPLKNSFAVGGCSKLAFKPSLKLSLKGATKRDGHPALKAVVTVPKRGNFANIAKAQVGLPHSEFLDQSNIGTVCTQPQLKADACPKKAIYGHAKAWTPLLDKPLEGPVYLGVGFGHKLPDLVADLNGQIRILLHGKTDTDKQEGIRNTFETVPDAPVSKFILQLKGGKKGLIVNSTNICKGTHKAEVDFKAQNGKTESFNAPIANSCKGKGKGGKKRKGKHKKAHAKGRQGQRSALLGRSGFGW
jgi:hypothetical protein